MAALQHRLSVAIIAFIVSCTISKPCENKQNVFRIRDRHPNMREDRASEGFSNQATLDQLEKLEDTKRMKFLSKESRYLSKVS